MNTYLIDPIKSARIESLRAAVTPILANNLLPYFTAHDVAHCDRVVELIDELIYDLQTSDKHLSQSELFVLYAAAYCHDVGMHYENAGDAAALRHAIGNRPWLQHTSDERRELLRRHHPAISAELVMRSVRNATPPLGLQLNDDDHPTAVACLCEAHGIDTDSERYSVLTALAPGIRTPLLAGILRCADILEESRRRANRVKAESLLLPVVSQVHWWRHYYTVDVTFDRAIRAVDVWFEYPQGRSSELSRIIPELQIPEVQAEFRRHDRVFAENNLVWFVRSRTVESPYSTTEDVPDHVLQEMLSILSLKRQQEALEHDRAVAAAFEEARPVLNRRLTQLRAQEAEVAPDVHVRELAALAHDMGRLGALVSARTVLREAFRKSERAMPGVRLDVGLELMSVLRDVGEYAELVRYSQQLDGLVASLDVADPRVLAYWKSRIEAEIRAGQFEHAVESLAARTAKGDDSEAPCVVEELDFLRGAGRELDR